jgi:hypothetical protein
MTVNQQSTSLERKNKSTVINCDVVIFSVGCYFVARNAAVVRSLTQRVVPTLVNSPKVPLQAAKLLVITI